MADTDLKITLTGEATQFSSTITKAQKEFKDAMTSFSTEAKKAKTDLDGAFKTLNLRAGDEILAEGVKIKQAFETIKASSSATSADVARASDAMKSKFQELGAEIKGNTPHIDSLGGAFTGMTAKLVAGVAAVASVAAAFKGVKDVISEGMGFEKTMKSLEFATGSSSQAKEAFNTLNEVANSLGLRVKDLEPGFVKFAAAAKGTALEGEGVKTVFTGVAQAMAALSLSGNEADGIMLALSQMLSKGKVSAEELRGQLGERLPGAMAAAARAAGVTEAEFSKMLETGQVIASEFLPKFAEELQNTFGEAAVANVSTLQGAINLMGNQIQKFFSDASNAGANDALKAAIQGIIDKFKQMSADGSLKEFANNIGQGIASLIKGLTELGIFLANNTKEIGLFVAALVGIKAISFTVGLISEIKALITLLAASTVGAEALALALKGIPLVFAAIAGYQLGTFLYEQFTKADKGVKLVDDSAAKLKDSLEKVSKVDIGKAFATVDKDLTSKIKEIDKEYSTATASIIANDKKTADEFKKNVDAKVAEGQRANQRFIAQENELSNAQKALANQKAALEASQRNADIAAKQASIQQEIQLTNQKNNQLATAEKKLQDDRAALDEVNSRKIVASRDKYAKEAANLEKAAAKEAAKAKVDADQDAINGIKRNIDQLSQSYKAGEQLRQLEHKKASDAIADRETQLKNQIEALKNQRIESERRLIAESNQLMQGRTEQLKNIEFAITENAKQAAKARVDAERAAIDQKVQIVKAASDKAIQAAQNEADTQVRLLRASDEYKRQSTQKWYEFDSDYAARKKRLDDDIQAKVADVSKRIIQIKEDEIAKINQLLKKSEDDYTAHIKKIQTLNEELLGKIKSYAEEEFQTNLKRMDDGSRYVALQGKIKDNIEQMQAVRQQADAAEGADKEKLIKQFQDLEQETRSYNKEAEVMGKTGTDAIVSMSKAADDYKTNLNLLKDASTGLIKDQKSYYEQAAASAKQASEDLKGTISTLKNEIQGMKDVKINIEAKLDAEKAKSDKKELEADSESTHSVTPDTAAARAEIAQLQMPTSSTHTVYVTRVETNAMGGFIQKFADGGFPRRMGFITGAGTDTSDDIPSMLSNNEFVIRASSVRKFGRDFFESLNSGYMPPVRKFSTGGLASSSSSAASQGKDVVTINHVIGGKSFQTMSPRDTALQLASALQHISRSA